MATGIARPSSVFASTAFARFYAGQALSYLGDGLRTLAIPLIVFRLTHSATAVGLTWGLELFPYALVSLVGGSLADRLDRRRVMIACDAVRFAVMAILAYVFWSGHISVAGIYVAVVVLAVAGSVFLSCQATVVPYLLGRERAKSGVAALFATEQSVNLVAPPIGGSLLSIAGPLPALIANALTYLCSQAAIASVPDFGPEHPKPFPSAREVRDDIVLGWRGMTRDRVMVLMTSASFVFNLVGTIGYVALIPFFKREFGASDVAVGIAWGCFALGSGIGAAIAGKTHWPIGRAIVITYLVDGVAWFALPLGTTMWFAVLGATISSICAGYNVTQIVSWRMRVIREDEVGRVFGVVRCVVLAGILPASILGGRLGDAIGARPTMLISAIGFLAVGIVLACSRQVRAERR